MGAEMKIPVIAQVITLIGCLVFVFVLAAHEKVSDWLKSGAKHAAKLIVTGGKHIAKATQHKKEHLISTPQRPKAA